MIVRVCSKKGCWHPIFWWQEIMSITLTARSGKKYKLNYCRKHCWEILNKLAENNS